MMFDPQQYYDLGFIAGKKLYSKNSSYPQVDLHNKAKQEAKAKPMLMQVHFRDGFLAGYDEAGQEVQKQQT